MRNKIDNKKWSNKKASHHNAFVEVEIGRNSIKNVD